ncbi:MAG: 2-oxoacid:acceptor oxidoreductase family protein [Dehalococcoidia bacterium]|nr:2-oxoacid:acceptor oxidoreductase family protein [Dehalococcoidia bacterium]
MKNGHRLPMKNDLGFYEMRFESVGGLGANLTGQILAEALVVGQGFNGAHFSTYGSEKKGSPVKSFVRVCAPEQEVRSSSPVSRPHLLAVFHSCLLSVTGTTSGLYEDSAVVVNSADSPEKIRDRARVVSGTVAVVDALGIAVQERTRINTVMLGAIVRVAGFIDPEIVKKHIAANIGDRYPHLVEPNRKSFERGFNEVKIEKVPYDSRFASAELHHGPIHEMVAEGHGAVLDAGTEFELLLRPGPALGYDNAPPGGTVVNPGNTIHKDHSASRQGIFPLYHRDRCIDCGLCTLTCPDYVFVWGPGVDREGHPAMVMRGPNLQYCKGCLKCVVICPVEALTMECERPEFRYTADPQLWGPIDALVNKGRDNEPAKWEQEEGYYWHRVG